MLFFLSVFVSFIRFGAAVSHSCDGAVAEMLLLVVRTPLPSSPLQANDDIRIVLPENLLKKRTHIHILIRCIRLTSFIRIDMWQHTRCCLSDHDGDRPKKQPVQPKETSHLCNFIGFGALTLAAAADAAWCVG